MIPSAAQQRQGLARRIAHCVQLRASASRGDWITNQRIGLDNGELRRSEDRCQQFKPAKPGQNCDQQGSIGEIAGIVDGRRHLKLRSHPASQASLRVAVVRESFGETRRHRDAHALREHGESAAVTRQARGVLP